MKNFDLKLEESKIVCEEDAKIGCKCKCDEES